MDEFTLFLVYKSSKNKRIKFLMRVESFPFCRLVGKGVLKQINKEILYNIHYWRLEAVLVIAVSTHALFQHLTGVPVYRPLLSQYISSAVQLSTPVPVARPWRPE